MDGLGILEFEGISVVLFDGDDGIPDELHSLLHCFASQTHQKGGTVDDVAFDPEIDGMVPGESHAEGMDIVEDLFLLNVKPFEGMGGDSCAADPVVSFELTVGEALDQNHSEAGIAETVCGGRTCGTRSDDEDIALHASILRCNIRYLCYT